MITLLIKESQGMTRDDESESATNDNDNASYMISPLLGKSPAMSDE